MNMAMGGMGQQGPNGGPQIANQMNSMNNQMQMNNMNVQGQQMGQMNNMMPMNINMNSGMQPNQMNVGFLRVLCSPAI